MLRRVVGNTILQTVGGFLFVLTIGASVAAAQGVTGTLSGTVKDAQGGVIPGATVTLISESRGTSSTPATTNSTGDFIFPNLTADTYTVQVEMPSFKTVKRARGRQPGLEHSHRRHRARNRRRVGNRRGPRRGRAPPVDHR